MIARILARVMLIMSIFLTCIGVYIYFVINAPTGQIPIEGQTFLINSGWSTQQIAQELYEQNIIRSPLYFRLLTRVLRKDNAIQSGMYMIHAHLSSYEVVKLLISGKIILERITIPEGLTTRSIAKLLAQSKIIASEQDFLNAVKDPRILQELEIFSKSAEGFLFPSTYMIQKPYPAEKIVHTMVNAFHANIKKIYPDYKSISWTDFYKKIILSSIIEKEYRVSHEAPIIASVFYNRLQSGIHLESCASIIYVLTELLRRPHPKRLFYIDLEIDSPYNSYLYKGLPPGPIANPGPTALAAAFNPAITNYLFFVVDNASKGTHTFTSNLNDHEEGKRLYLETYFPK